MRSSRLASAMHPMLGTDSPSNTDLKRHPGCQVAHLSTVSKSFHLVLGIRKEERERERGRQEGENQGDQFRPGTVRGQRNSPVERVISER